VERPVILALKVMRCCFQNNYKPISKSQANKNPAASLQEPAFQENNSKAAKPRASLGSNRLLYEEAKLCKIKQGPDLRAQWRPFPAMFAHQLVELVYVVAGAGLDLHWML
jgi:hypothetical protein